MPATCARKSVREERVHHRVHGKPATPGIDRDKIGGPRPSRLGEKPRHIVWRAGAGGCNRRTTTQLDRNQFTKGSARGPMRAARPPEGGWGGTIRAEIAQIRSPPPPHHTKA
jgi:hypothetical protein